MQPELKTKKEIEIMREGGKKLARIFDVVKKEIKPGITPWYLEELVEDLIKKEGARPACKNYKTSEFAESYPCCICACVNEQIVHVVPEKDRVLKEGDIITVDTAIIWQDFYLDKAITFPIGKVDFEVQRFLKVGKKALKLGIKKAKVGNTLGDIGNTIQRFVESQGFTILKEFCGHEIGRTFHGSFNVLNFGKRKKGLPIQEGMTFCIEPIISMGSNEIVPLPKFGYITKDKSLACHFEDTIAIVNGKAQVLTQL